ncbi:NADH dehydrogenase [[Actinomadura] parvosata subsp. kistnae]|uniref:NAD(P)/FAD-dependent oxidoreductase n=1 Tax=[Actinomadura] parvosata TaxID=1955412 RepID=UPI0009AD0EEB|nr:FAD-dependent oxidoreductase [Nonomuraea sp. ATCC 55076]SPL97991.1 NADH dehydrogenase [Actinomadura parvosata subsp. kistnae]
MPHIVILGAGFAGVWAAAAAARVRDGADLDITLVAPDDELVLRPRMYEAEPDRATVPLAGLLKPIDVRHRRAWAERIDVERREVHAGGDVLGYDRLVLATGSRLVRPELPGAGLLFDVDTLRGARRLADHLRGREGFTAVVVGAGFTGLEVATELAGRGRVVLVERADVVGPDLGPTPRPSIEDALDRLGIEVRLRTSLHAVEPGAAVLSDGTRVAADAVIWTAGMRADALTEQVPARRDRLGRLAVDRWMRVEEPSGAVFAAGDVAAARFDDSHDVMQSCQHATPMGKTAGHNAAADLLGLEPIDFAPAPYVTCLDLGAAGGLYTKGWDRQVALSGERGKEVKQWIMRRIQPPVDDAEQLLALAGMVRLPIPF